MNYCVRIKDAIKAIYGKIGEEGITLILLTEHATDWNYIYCAPLYIAHTSS